MSKEFLRKKLIIFRKNNFIDKDITFIKFQRILKKFNLKKKINIGGYYPINSEINSLNILEKLERNNFKISLPVIKNKNTMDFYEWSFKDILRVSNRGIPEPVANKKVIPDVLIVPMVGFDKHKFRLFPLHIDLSRRVVSPRRIISPSSFKELFKSLHVLVTSFHGFLFIGVELPVTHRCHQRPIDVEPCT